jgi:hypothetical protein
MSAMAESLGNLVSHVVVKEKSHSKSALICWATNASISTR